MIHMTRHSVGRLAIAAAVLAFAATAFAQKPVTQGEAVTETFTIQAIDYTKRIIEVKDSAGNPEVMTLGPEVKRFNELKAGDKITVRYYESLVYAIRAAGQASPKATGEPAVVRGTGAKPSATVSQQLTASVVLTAIDPKVPSVTVKTDDGQVMSFKVENKKNLEGVKVGDRVDITYTMAVAISVASPK